MEFPRYWAKGRATSVSPDGRTLTTSAYGWSSESREAARAKGEERARQFIASGFPRTDRKEDYDYGNAPLREEVIDRLIHDNREIAVISRNRYGALVLNTAQALFVDIDLPAKPGNFWECLVSNFSSSKRKELQSRAADLQIEQLKQWAAQNPSKAFRVYRTFAGFRLLFVDQPYEPRNGETSRILAELEADALYRNLTERQECFRARLTPKPWRIGKSRPPHPYPWEEPDRELAARRWEKAYQDRSSAFTVCHLIKEIGTPQANAVLQKIVQTHDALAVDQNKPLA